MQSRLLRSGAAALGAAMVAALALAGCSSSGGQDGPTTLNYTIWDQNQEPALREVADEFEALNPNVDVEITVIPSKDYWTKIQTQMSAGTGPDVFWVNGPNFQLYASNGQLAPLDDTGIETGDYPESLVDLYTYDGSLYGAPKDFDTIGVYYNKALFDEAGLEYPAAGWTWAEIGRASCRERGL